MRAVPSHCARVGTCATQEEYSKRRQQKYTMITNDSKAIHKYMKDSNRKLKVSTGLPDWKAYIDFVNAICYEGLLRAATTSLKFLKVCAR